MRATYPLTSGYLEHLEPEFANERSRRTQSGRIRSHKLGRYSDHAVQITHAAVDKAVVQTVMDFYDNVDGAAFNLQTGLDDHWIASFRKRPLVTHLGGGHYTVVIEVNRYDPAEGGW